MLDFPVMLGISYLTKKDFFVVIAKPFLETYTGKKSVLVIS